MVEAQPLPKSVEGQLRKGTAFPHIEAAEPQKLARHLRGDSENIVLKALRREPQRRYTSVEQFSEDIRRHPAVLRFLRAKPRFQMMKLGSR